MIRNDEELKIYKNTEPVIISASKEHKTRI